MNRNRSATNLMEEDTVDGEQNPLFVDSNIGTHFAVAISPYITAGELKSKLADEHSCCFPRFGEIKILSLLVRRGYNYYHLPDTMPMKNAYEGVRGTWFLQIDVCRMEEVSMEEVIKEIKCLHNSVACLAPDNMLKSEALASSGLHPCKGIKKLADPCKVRGTYSLGAQAWQRASLTTSGKETRGNLCENMPNVQKFHKQISGGYLGDELGRESPSSINDIQVIIRKQLDQKEKLNYLSNLETSSISQSEKLSVTGIISRYFSEIDDVTSPVKWLQDIGGTEDTMEQVGISNSKETGQHRINRSIAHASECLGYKRRKTANNECSLDALCSSDKLALNLKQSDDKFADTDCERVTKTKMGEAAENLSNVFHTKVFRQYGSGSNKRECRKTKMGEAAENLSDIFHTKVFRQYGSGSNKRECTKSIKSICASSYPSGHHKIVKSSKSRIDDKYVGKCLINAAKDLSPVVKSPSSVVLSRCSDLSALKSSSQIQAFAFETSDLR